MTFACSLLLLAAIALACLVAGRLFVGGFGSDLFRRLDPAGAAAALAIGAAVLTLLSSWLSAVGLSAPAMLPLVVALQSIPLALCWRRGRLDVLRPSGTAREWSSLGLPIATTAFLALLPLLLTNGYAVGNDTYTYGAFSEWLQRHGFSEARWETQSPVTGIPALWRSLHYDLGIAHWLALVQAGTRAPVVLLVYPSTAAYGMALLVSMLWLVARQVLRLGVVRAGLAASLFAAVPHALYWGHHNGFLQQTYALPIALFGLVLLARSSALRRGSFANAPLLALPFAFLISVYVPLLPTLLIATTTALAPALARARRRSETLRLAGLLGSTVLLVLLVTLRDLSGIVTRTHMFATYLAGQHIPFSALQFFQFAMGTRVLAPGWTSAETAPWTDINRALTPVYGALVLLGLWRTWRRPRWWPLAATASLLFAGIAYYALLVKDPWTGRLGQTWNVFKLTQWAWPFVCLLAVVGLRWLAARLRRGRLPVVALAWALPITMLGAHWTWARQLGGTMQEVLPGPSPLRDLPALKQRILNLPEGTLLVVGKPSDRGRWLGAVTCLLAYPRAIVGDWAGSASLPSRPPGDDALHASLLSRIGEPGIVPILAGFVPFQTEGVEVLGGGFAHLLPGDAPVILYVRNPADFERSGDEPGEPAFPIGRGRTKIVVFTRVEQPAELRLTLRPYPGRVGSRLAVHVTAGDYDHRALRSAMEKPPGIKVALDGETDLRVPLPPARGLRTVILHVEERRAGAPARAPLIVVGLHLSLSGPGAGGSGDSTPP